MAPSGSSAGGGAEQAIDIPQWLKTLPLAPEYRPTLAEFQDPISYILQIEKEASEYGICKIVPPLPPAPKKTVISNLNNSLGSQNPSTNPKSAPTFTTKQQQLGLCSQTPRWVQKPLWNSGKRYTLQEFEEKAKNFESSYMKTSGKKKNKKKRKKKNTFSAMEIETLFWKATLDEPFSVEFAGDLPGSAFAPIDEKKLRKSSQAATVGETAWNMGGVSRAKGSLLRFMEDEIPGVNSPTLYLSMLFSWFAWQARDHDLHSLNYMHMGAAKTWYGVPRDAAEAFEEVVGVHGYGGDVNPLVTFAILGEKTTVMSPEVLIDKGIPCCRLVQNAGEFVVTFPRAYHSGFGHGFNCCEAANIATPKWLMVAKEAAIRRASTNPPPILSHFQLLYAFALSLYTRVPKSISMKPCSSMVKDTKIEGETIVKELFVRDVMQKNDLLDVLLEKGSSCVLLQQKYSDASECSNLHARMRTKVRPRLLFGLCSLDGEMEATKVSPSNDIMQDRNTWFRPLTKFYSVRKKPSFVSEGNKSPSLSVKNAQCGDADLCNSTSETEDIIPDKESISHGYRLSGQDLFSCVACGIQSACSVVIQPREAAARYLMSAEFSFFNDWLVGSGALDDRLAECITDANTSELSSCSDAVDKTNLDDLYDVPDRSASYQVLDQMVDAPSDTEAQRSISSLDLLAVTYGNSSDSEEELIGAEMPMGVDENESGDSLPLCKEDESSQSAHGVFSPQTNFLCGSSTRNGKSVKANSGGMKSERAVCDFAEVSNCTCDISECATASFSETNKHCNVGVHMKNVHMLVKQSSDKCSSRSHIFCLEHAVEVEKQLRSIGGVHLLLLCHPEYPQAVAGAKSFAEELGIDYLWKDLPFREASKEDQERIQSALDGEEDRPRNEDWAVKLGISLSFVSRLSHSPLYSKQMPYNAVIYKAFGCNSLPRSSTKLKVSSRRLGKGNKMAVGKWCGKVWMSNQVHPYLALRHTNEDEPSIGVNSGAIPEFEAKAELQATCLDEQEPVPEQNCLQSASTCGTRKAGKKRKIISTKGASKKPKYIQLDSSVEVLKDTPKSISTGQRRGTSRSRQMKRKTRQLFDSKVENNLQHDSKAKEKCARGPSTQCRKTSKPPEEDKINSKSQSQSKKKDNKKASSIDKDTPTHEEAKYQCGMDGCTMGFRLKQELVLHKNNICPVRGCGKKFFAHKYLVQHKRVHVDDRPLKCPWKGCKMTFKWPWARTEHIRVHTGVRPYICREPGCGQTFRFVSDFSRHKRKTGHSVKKKKGKG